MLILFPQSVSAQMTVDPEFAPELRSAVSAGFTTCLYDHRAAASGEPDEKLAAHADDSGRQDVVLRGWMLPSERYATLYRQLVAKSYQPVTTPDAYDEAHYLPNAYQHIENATARSAWIEGDDVDRAWLLYQDFQSRDAIIKDWVKSAKSRWEDGCYIPKGTDEVRFREIYAVFRTTRGKLFNRGVVLREYMPVMQHGFDIRGLPLIEETRLFFWNGNLVVRPDERSPSPVDELPRWTSIARKFRSPFVSIDVAYLTDGSWRIVEVGDGGVSGLPMGLTPERFYARLWCMISEEH